MGPQQGRSTAPAANRKEGNKVVRYMQCQRNHAARTGGHAVDGCPEFMAPAPAPAAEGTAAALLCAGCGCHRSFHRREVVFEAEAAAECEAPPTPPAPGDRR